MSATSSPWLPDGLRAQPIRPDAEEALALDLERVRDVVQDARERLVVHGRGAPAHQEAGRAAGEAAPAARSAGAVASTGRETVNGGPAPDLAVEPDLPAVLLDDLAGDRHAEPDAARLAVGEEGLVDPRLQLLGDSVAGVGEVDLDVFVAARASAPGRCRPPPWRPARCWRCSASRAASGRRPPRSRPGSRGRARSGCRGWPGPAPGAASAWPSAPPGRRCGAATAWGRRA